MMTPLELALLDMLGDRWEELAKLEQLRGVAFFELTFPIKSVGPERGSGGERPELAVSPAPAPRPTVYEKRVEKRISGVRQKLELELEQTMAPALRPRPPPARPNGHAHDCLCASKICVIARAVSEARGTSGA